MALEEGFVEIGVRPSSKGFSAELRSQLAEVERKLPAVDVRLAGQIARDFVSKANEQIKVALEKVRPVVDLGIAKTSTNRATIKREAVAQIDEALKTVRPVVDIGVSTSKASVDKALGEVEAAVQEAQAAAVVNARFDVDASVLLADARAAIELVTPELPRLNVLFDVDASQLAVEARAAIELAGGELAVGSKLNVHFDVDPTELIAKAQAAVLVTQESITGINVGTAGGGALAAAAVAGPTAAVGATEVATAATPTTIGASAAAGSRLASTVGKGLLGVTAATGLVGVGLLKLGGDFEEGFNRIRLATGLTGEPLEKLRETLVNVSGQTAAPLDQVGAAIAGVAQKTGATGATLENLSLSLIKLSRITKTDLGTNLDASIGLFRNWQISAADAPATLDKLWRAAQISGKTVGELAGTLQTSGAGLRAAGFTIDQSTAMLTGLTKAGLPAEQILQSMTKAAAGLAKAGKDPAKGIADLIERIKEAKNPTEALGEAIQSKLFGRPQNAVAAVEAIRRGALDISGIQSQITASGGDTISKAASAVSSIGGKMAMLRNSLSAALQPVATPLIDAIKGGVAEFAKSVQSHAVEIKEAFAKFGPVIAAAIQGVLSLLPAVLPVLSAIGTALGFIAEHASFLKPVIVALVAAFVGMKVVGLVTTLVEGLGAAFAFLTSPIGIVIALGAAFVLAYEKIKPFRDLVDGIASAIAGFVGTVVEGIKSLVDLIASGGIFDLLGAIFGSLGDLGIGLLEWFGSGIRSLVGGIPDAVIGLIEWAVGLPGQILGWLGDLGSVLVGWFTTAFLWVVTSGPTILTDIAGWIVSVPVKILGWLGDLGSKIGRWLMDAFRWPVVNGVSVLGDIMRWHMELPGKIIGWLGDLGPAVGKWFGDAFRSAVGIVEGIVGGLGNMIKGAIEIPINLVIDGINWLVKQANKVIEYIPGVDYLSEIDHVKLAEGGIFTVETRAIIAEDGPELVLPLTKPGRMLELLRQSGALDTIKASIPVTAAPSLAAAATTAPIEPVTKWVAKTAEAFSRIGPAMKDASAPGLAALNTSTGESFTAGGAALVRIMETTRPKLVDAMRVTGDQLAIAARSAGERIAQALEDGVKSGTPKLLAAVQTYASALAAALNPILAAIGQPSIDVAKLGPSATAKRLAEGGRVDGPNVRRDVVPALLMPGEVVVKRDSVERFGVGNMLDLNAGRVPTGWSIPRFADGGAVAAPAAATSAAPGLSPGALAAGKAVADGAVGKPYSWGAVGPDAFDCSGLWSAIVSAVRGTSPGRLFTSSSLVDNGGRNIGMVPGLGQISVGVFKGNPGHVGGTLGGVNYEATPPAVRKGVGARGAADPLFTHRFHLGSGFYLEPGRSIVLPEQPKLDKAGELARTAAAFAAMTGLDASKFVAANTFASDTTLASLAEAGATGSTSAAAAGWIARALALTGAPASWASGLLTIARRESGFNPAAVNLVDSNARAGHPSRGLMQMIDSTFAAHAVPGHTNINDPVDNAAAAIRYITARYGDISRVQQADPSRSPRGYADGGLVTADARRAVGSLVSRFGSVVGADGPTSGASTFGSVAPVAPAPSHTALVGALVEALSTSGADGSTSGAKFRDVVLQMPPAPAQSPEAWWATMMYRVGPQIAAAVGD